jgi:hypothetical protein
LLAAVLLVFFADNRMNTEITIEMNMNMTIDQQYDLCLTSNDLLESLIARRSLAAPDDYLIEIQNVKHMRNIENAASENVRAIESDETRIAGAAARA